MGTSISIKKEAMWSRKKAGNMRNAFAAALIGSGKDWRMTNCKSSLFIVFLVIFAHVAKAENICDLNVGIVRVAKAEVEKNIRLRMDVKNEGQDFSPIQIPATFYAPYYNLEIEIKDKMGRVLEYKGPELKGGSSGKLVWLYPGYSLGREIEVEPDWWSLSSEMYRLKIYYLPWRELGKRSTCTIVSNEISIDLR